MVRDVWQLQLFVRRDPRLRFPCDDKLVEAELKERMSDGEKTNFMYKILEFLLGEIMLVIFDLCRINDSQPESQKFQDGLRGWGRYGDVDFATTP